MTTVITWITDVFGINLATVDTTDITLGLIAALGLVVGLALSVFRRVRGRG